MNYLVVHCHSCGDAALVETRFLTLGAAACARCEAPSALFGSNSYGYGDLVQFNDIRYAARDAQLKPAEAAELLQQVKRAAREETTMRAELRQVVLRVRSVAITNALQDPVPSLHHTVGILLTVLAAIAMTRGQAEA